MPPVDSRTRDGFVGLKNGGATCYMNSLLQQLYMTPGIPEYLLAIDDEQMDEERSVFLSELSEYLDEAWITTYVYTYVLGTCKHMLIL